MIRAYMSWSRVLAATMILGVGANAHAQLANASTAATALGGAFTARASGYNAVAWNPANLAMPGNPGFSFTLLGVEAQAGLKPIDLARVKPYGGDTIPKAIREEWMLDVERDGGQKGNVGAGVTGIAFSLGSLGFQYSGKVASDMNLAPGAVEALLFGNAGRTGTVKALDLAGSSFQTAIYSTAALSYGMRLPAVPLADFAVGATVKYTIGHALVSGIDNGSSIGTSNVTVAFPMIYPDSAAIKSGQLGSGIGLDLGAAWKLPNMRFGVSMQNVINTFQWDSTKLATRSAIGAFSQDTNYFDTDSTDQPYASAPVGLRDHVAGLKFKPVLAAGVAFDWLPKITISADIRQQVGDGIEAGPKSMIGAGAEFRWIPFIPIRGGVTMMTGGVGFSGGFGLRVLGFEAGAGGYVRKRDGGSESGVTINLFSIRP